MVCRAPTAGGRQGTKTIAPNTEAHESLRRQKPSKERYGYGIRRVTTPRFTFSTFAGRAKGLSANEGSPLDAICRGMLDPDQRRNGRIDPSTGRMNAVPSGSRDGCGARLMRDAGFRRPGWGDRPDRFKAPD